MKRSYGRVRGPTEAQRQRIGPLFKNQFAQRRCLLKQIGNGSMTSLIYAITKTHLRTIMETLFTQLLHLQQSGDGPALNALVTMASVCFEGILIGAQSTVIRHKCTLLAF